MKFRNEHITVWASRCLTPGCLFGPAAFFTNSTPAAFHRRTLLEGIRRVPRPIWFTWVFVILVVWYTLWGWYSIVTTLWLINKRRSQLRLGSPVKVAADLLILTFYYGVEPRIYLTFGLSNVPRARWLTYVFPQQQHMWHGIVGANTPQGQSANVSKQAIKDKDRFREVCETAGIPVPKTVDVVSHGQVETVFRKQSVFLKPVIGSQMLGCFALDYAKEDGTYALDGKSMTGEFLSLTQDHDIRAAIEAILIRQPLLVQPLLSNQDAVAEISETKQLTTVRVISVTQETGPVIVAAVAEIPSKIVGRWHLFALDVETSEIMPPPNTIA